jgi:hypothetical protein
VVKVKTATARSIAPSRASCASREVGVAATELARRTRDVRATGGAESTAASAASVAAPPSAAPASVASRGAAASGGGGGAGGSAMKVVALWETSTSPLDFSIKR